MEPQTMQFKHCNKLHDKEHSDLEQKQKKNLNQIITHVDSQAIATHLAFSHSCCFYTETEFI